MLAKIACSLASTILLLGADRPTDAPAKLVPADLQGKWKLVSLEISGKAFDLGDSQPKWIIKGNKVRYGGEELARLTVDPSAAPKIIDLGFLKPKKVYEGIYSIDKDSLKVCLNKQTEGVKERPPDFSTKDKENLRLLVFEREKADEGGDETEGLIGFIGVALRFDRERNEIVVSDVLNDSPAKKAGLRQKDVVLKIGGAGPASLRSAIDMVRRAKPGSQLAFHVRRSDKETDVLIKVGIMPFAMLAELD